MGNLFDYLSWRGDLTLAQADFNEIDSLILSELSYLEMDEVFVTSETTYTIKEAADLFHGSEAELFMQKNSKFMRENTELLQILRDCPRFMNMKITGYVNHIDLSSEKQFCAMLITMDENRSFISFRGTDSTLVGWKESLNMSFSKVIPSQAEAVDYLNVMGSRINGRLYLGGHSKGGNLAVYAAAHGNQEIKNRIIQVYNHDGPGFDMDVISSNVFTDILDKIQTIVPQSSIVGMLLEHEEPYKVVQSTESGILQHDCFSWQLMNQNFICLDTVSGHSKRVNQTIRTFLQGLEPEQLKNCIDIIYDVLNQTQAKTVGELTGEKLKNTLTILKTYKYSDEITKKKIKLVAYELIKAAKENAANGARNKKNQLTTQVSTTARQKTSAVGHAIKENRLVKSVAGSSIVKGKLRKKTK